MHKNSKYIDNVFEKTKVFKIKVGKMTGKQDCEILTFNS